MGPGSKGQNGVAVVLASIAFGDQMPLVRVPPETLCRCAGKEKMRERNNEFHIRLNDEEYRKLDWLSHTSGTSFNQVIRKLIMGREIRQRPNADFAALVCSIDRLGNNVNQIAKKANTNNAVSYADMKEVTAIMRGVRLEIDRWKEQWL